LTRRRERLITKGRIEIFGGYLPVVTIERDKAKTAGNCKTNQSHVTNPAAYLFFLT
jgi:hypothetical protein